MSSRARWSKPTRPRILGAGVVRDGVAALAWLLRGRRGGSALANFLKDASAALLAEEIAEAERRAVAPLPEPSP